jgi:hypothetical protein
LAGLCARQKYVYFYLGDREMKRLFVALLSLLLLTLNSNVFSKQEKPDRSDNPASIIKSKNLNKQENEQPQINNYLIDFSDYEAGSIDAWLESKGFKFEQAARDRKKLDLDVDEGALILEAKTRLRGFIVNDSLEPRKYSGVRVEWGVVKYPRGASYEAEVNNEAIQVLIFFGHEKISSGHLVLPNSPYFIGLFLGRHDMPYKAYKGKYYQEGGRFVCMGNPLPGETIISEFDLVYAFKRYFQRDEVPRITGVALVMDTTSSGDDGRAVAFVNRLEFFE